MMQQKKQPLHPTVIAAGWVSFLTDFSSEMIYPLLPLFLTDVLRSSVAFVGVLEGVAETTASLLKLFSGWLSDRLGKRRPLLLFGYTLSSISRPLVALATGGGQVLALRVSDRVGKGLRGAPRDALVKDVTPPESRGRAFGFHRAMDHAGAVVGPLVAFALLYGLGWSFRRIFALAAIPAALAVLAAFIGVKDAPARHSAAAARPPLSPREWARLDRRLLAIIGIITLFTLGNSSDAFLILRARQLGVPMMAIPLLWIVLHVVKSTTSTPSGALSDRVGRRPLMLAGWSIYALTYLGFALARAPWQIWLLFLVYGGFFGLTEGAERALVADLTRSEEAGAAFGLYGFAQGMAALPASALFGLIWQRFGAPAAFIWGALLAILACLALAYCTRRPATPAAATAPASLPRSPR